MEIKIYTDGGSRGNGEKDAISAWAYIILSGGNEHFGSRAYEGYTNNQMELAGIINALKSISGIQNVQVKVYSDSAYCVNGITSWIHGWKKNGWKNSKKQEVENIHYWKTLDKLVSSFSKIEFIKVKGHSNDYYNTKVDKLVNEAMDNYIKVK